MIRCAMLIAAGLAAVLLVGCLTTTASVPVWEHFDACPERAPFHDWVTCAKQNRQAACDANHNCSSNPNTVIAYAESLDQSVQRHEITETEARRRWAVYRADREVAQSQAKRSTQDRASDAAAAPAFCTFGRSNGC